jgi:glutathione reductase (NADPH)
MEYDVDLMVIGAGSGGVRAARIAAGYGASTLIAEEFRIGGTCVIRGCVPKKLLVYASRFRDDFEDAAGYGWTVEGARFDWRTMVAAKEKEITRLSGIYRQNLEKAGVGIFEGRAVVEGAQSVRLSDGRLIRARHILIATGAAPELAPTIPGLEHAISSNEIFDLPKFPDRLLIVGGGYIAVEFASLMSRLGAKVVQAMRAENVLRGFDDDMREGVRAALAHAGVEHRFRCLPTRIDRTAAALRVALSNGGTIEVDQVLIATGRKPNTTNIGLEAAGVELLESGAVKVDDYSRSSVETIHAIGDVTDRLALTPVAIREGHALADTLFGGKRVAADHVNVPSAVFTTPELGVVGLSEEDARDRYDVVDVYLSKFRPMKATLSGRDEKVIMKIIVNGVTDRVLGVHILGHEAGEMIQMIGVAVHAGVTKAALDATTAVHPTASEELVTMRHRTARYERAKA